MPASLAASARLIPSKALAIASIRKAAPRVAPPSAGVVARAGAAQGWALHAGEPGGLGPAHPLQGVGDRQHPQGRPPVRLASRVPAQRPGWQGAPGRRRPPTPPPPRPPPPPAGAPPRLAGPPGSAAPRPSSPPSSAVVRADRESTPPRSRKVNSSDRRYDLVIAGGLAAATVEVVLEDDPLGFRGQPL